MSLHSLSRLSILAVLVGATTLPACFLYRVSSSGGAAIYRREHCSDCHGERGVGSPSGPALIGLRENWTTAALKDYLADPERFLAEDARLAGLARRYGTRMASHAHLPEDQREALASYLLLEPGSGR